METLPEKIRRLRKARGWKQGDFGARVGVDQTTVSRWESGQIIPGGNHLMAISRIFAKSVEELLGSTPVDVSFKVLLVGYVEAGAWREAIEVPKGDQREVTTLRPRSSAADKAFGLEVRGQSMNAVFPEGTTLVCVRLLDMPRDLRNGDYVIAVRHRRGEIEATCKQLVMQDGKPWLWPRSTDPRFQQPIPGFELDGQSEEGDFAEIFAVVIHASMDFS